MTCALTYAKAYYIANANAIKAKKRDNYRRNPEVSRGKSLWDKYGLTVETYSQMLDKQRGICANPDCFNGPSDSSKGCLEIDHDHTCCPGQKSCGKCIRGLLCSGCNAALGYVHDDIKRLRGLVNYLE